MNVYSRDLIFVGLPAKYMKRGWAINAFISEYNQKSIFFLHNN